MVYFVPIMPCTMEETLFRFLAQHITLEEAEKDHFRKLNLVREYTKGTVLLREGQYAKESYFVIRGCLRSYYLVDDEEKTTAFYLEEDSLAPESLMQQAPSEYYVVCEEDCLLLVANPAMEVEVFAKFPKFETLCRVLSEKELAKQQANMGTFMKSSPEERYLHLQKHRPQLLERVPQYHIASYVGVKPETLSRIRKKLSQQGG